MAKIKSGDIKLITVQSAGGSKFNMEHKSEDTVNVKNKKGYRVDDSDTNRGANGTIILKYNAVNPSITLTVLNYAGLTSLVEDVIGEEEEATFLFALRNGTTLSGSGMFVGDIESDEQAGTLPLTINFSGSLKEL